MASLRPKKKDSFGSFIFRVEGKTKPHKLLPNGYYIGQKVYYEDTMYGRIYGIVQKKEDRDNKHMVWAVWGDEEDGPLSYMPVDMVFPAEPTEA